MSARGKIQLIVMNKLFRSDIGITGRGLVRKGGGGGLTGGFGLLLLVHGSVANGDVDGVSVVMMVVAGAVLVVKSTGLAFYILIIHMLVLRVLGDDVPGVEQTRKEAQYAERNVDERVDSAHTGLDPHWKRRKHYR